MKIISFNVNGLRARIKDNTIYTLINDENPDFLCLQEIRCDISDITGFSNKIKELYPYQIYNSSSEKKGYSGTAILTKVPPLSIILDAIPNTEGRIIILIYDKFILINIYSPNSGRNFDRLIYRINVWETKLNEIIKLYKEKYPSHYLILCGDFNVATDPIDVDMKTIVAGFTEPERTSHKHLIESNQLVDIFRLLYPNKKQLTWFGAYINMYISDISKKYGMRIDKFLINNELIKCVKDTFLIQKFYGSDHIPIVLELI